MTEQEKFENHLLSLGAKDLTKFDDTDEICTYTRLSYEHAWRAWKAAIASREPMEWQPIETAPKTSKAILVYCAERKNTHVVIWGKVGGFFQQDGWRHFGGGGEMTELPTHWMPLPPPPKE